MSFLNSRSPEAALAFGPKAPDIGPMPSPHVTRSLSRRLGVETGEAVLRYELLQEQAAALGRQGARLEAALAALNGHAGGEGRAALVREAADAAWCFFVQREVIGLRDRAGVIAQYAIPREVLNRIGAR